MRTKWMKSLLLLLLALGAPSQAMHDVQGVVSVTPVLQHACIAAEFELAAGEVLVGLRWYNNDGLIEFPTVLLLESSEGGPPDVSNAAVAIERVSAGSSSWGEVLLPTPVTASSGVVQVVFELPAGAERSGEGEGAGPGIGFVASTGTSRAYLSPDGATWIQVRRDFALAVEPIIALGRGAVPQTLESLRPELEAGWWGEVTPNQVVLDAAAESEDVVSEASVVSASRPLAAFPNPFNPRVTIEYYVAVTGPVDVSVFDVRGRRVRTLVDQSVALGAHTVSWDGFDEFRRPVASGVYFLKATTAKGTTTQRVALVR